MKRREFLGLVLIAIAGLPMSLSATDFRKTKPNAWTEKNVYDGDKPTTKGVEAAIKDLYGDVKPVEEGVSIKLPKVANNGGQVPVQFKVDKDVKTVALFQDVNPECLVAVYEVNENIIPEFFVKIKMKQSGDVIVVAEGKDGKFYMGKQSIEVALGGCEG